jgi:hypothetical protein
MSERKLVSKTVRAWLPLAAVIVIFTGLVCVTVQQNYRMSANDPQIQIAEDIAEALSSGKAQADAIVPPQPTAEMAPSLATFVVIYSATGTPIGSSVALDGKLPTLPAGVLDAAKLRGENRLTWQPKTGVRIAAVVVSFSGPNPGYVLAGRSLREVEVRESQLNIMAASAGGLALVVAFLILMYFAKGEERHRENEAVADHHHEGQAHHEHHS